MVQAYRLLVQKLDEEGLKPYPLHLGVTEAGEAEDGRIKSAVGIGTLLEDGLGDTVRVSLTEEPEFEIPVAKALVDRYLKRAGHEEIRPISINPINPFQYQKRKSDEVFNMGGKNVPRVFADFSGVSVLEKKQLKAIGHHYLPELDKWHLDDQGADYIYAGDTLIPFMLANGSRVVYNYETWKNAEDKKNSFPAFSMEQINAGISEFHEEANFLFFPANEIGEHQISILSSIPKLVVILSSENAHKLSEMRRFFIEILNKEIHCPVILSGFYSDENESNLQLFGATDLGGLLIEGLGDGIMIGWDKAADIDGNKAELKIVNQLSFGILQAARTRMSKTEYISCPSCGRTLFDLQETTAMIRKRTDHLKGVKIGIMGCIVNGPGEMADADYGYVGVGKDKIALYRGQNVVKKAVPALNAVDELIELIKEDGVWLEPSDVLSFATN
jgi:(E)-4-hydroxy-3-methylbut-2-enyl-diphosphate synthase